MAQVTKTYHKCPHVTRTYRCLIKLPNCNLLPTAVDSDDVIVCKRRKLAYITSDEEGEHMFWCVLSVPCDLNIQGDYQTDVNIEMLAFPSCSYRFRSK